MINEAATFKWKGYYSTDLSRGSQKKVWAVCDICGKGRWVKYRNYHALCRSCAQIGKKHTEEHKKKIGDACRGEKSPNYGKKVSARTKNRMRLAYVNLPDDIKEIRRLQCIDAAKNAPPITDATRKKLTASRTGEKNPFYGKKHTEETRKKMSMAWDRSDERVNAMSEARKGKKPAEATRRKMSETRKGKQRGEENPMWKGGISFLPYCSKFNKTFKESIREKFNRTCFLCGTTEKELNKKLSVHHVAYQKGCLCDDDLPNCEFVPLCTKCHSKTNHNRPYWEKYIMEKLHKA